MWGGGRIDGSPEAPEKFIAANELKRVYDLEHGRFQMQERRNMLFPFLAPFGHSFALNNNVLDGDVAFDLIAGPPPGVEPAPAGPAPAPRAVRSPRFTENPLILDGVHMRRMWMMNNPVVLVRAMMDPATRLSAPRQERGLSVIDVTLKAGDKLTAGFERGGRPAFVRWAHPQSNLGQANLTTTWSGWVHWDGQGGVLMPLGYQTRLDWRNVDFFKMYVDAYKVDSEIADLAAPAAVRAAAEPPSYRVQPLTSVPIAKGMWRIDQGGTTVIEFKDHVVLYELPANSRGQAKATIAYARGLAGGKPVRYLITSHNHFDHTVGVRQAVAEGITIIQRPSTLEQFRTMAAHPAPDFPDDLAKAAKPMKSMALDEHLRLQDETRTLDVYWGRNNGHMADVVFAYEPREKVMMEGDMVTAAFDWQHWPDTFRDVIAYYRLDVERISPVHSVWREHPDILTRAQADELLKGGTERARQHCADMLAKGNYWPGCPVQSKYY
jgi:glyoxylase-like metal-dependent hydrolase (beta-lactamase superfamily II)